MGAETPNQVAVECKNSAEQAGPRGVHMSAVAASSPAPLFSPAFIQDPYPTYRMYLDGPAIQAPIPPPPQAFVFQYEDI
jgi:hypothetical protein